MNNIASIKHRLNHLEKALPPEEAGPFPYPGFPPCPPGADPEKWYRKQSIGKCIKLMIEGKLPVGEYLPGMTEEEKRRVDHWWRILAFFRRRYSDGGV